MSKNIFCALFTLLLFTGVDCKKNPVTPGETTFKITTEDASCTEAYINLFLAGSESNRNVILKRGDSTIAAIVINGEDSLIVDEGLLPSKTYAYTMIWNGYSRSAQVTTMDTTSHDWKFETFPLGGASSSTLYDVAIINDTLAYAVGEIYLYDSSGQIDPYPYNVAMWNGKDWKLQKLYANNFPPPIKAIFAYNGNDIWFSPWFHWNGKEFKQIPSAPIFFGIGINKMWGDADGLSAVGTNGFVAHLTTKDDWRKIESGTTLPINDIWEAIIREQKSMKY